MSDVLFRPTVGPLVRVVVCLFVLSRTVTEIQRSTYCPKIANFAHPLSLSALVRGDPLRISGKALRFLKLYYNRVFHAADGEDLVILACTAFD